MFPSLEIKRQRFEELERRLQDPVILANPTQLVEIQREYGGLRKIAEPVRRYHRLVDDIAGAKEMLAVETNPDSRSYIEAEIKSFEQQLTALQVELEDLATAGDSATRASVSWRISWNRERSSPPRIPGPWTSASGRSPPRTRQ